MRQPFLARALIPLHYYSCTFSSSASRRHNHTTTNDNSDTNHDVIIDGDVPRGGVGIAVGQVARARRKYTQNDLVRFSQVSNDWNPLHHHPPLSSTDNDDDTHADGPIVHGMLVASMFSYIFGTLIPGCMYRKQSLTWKRPVYVDEYVVGEIRVVRVRRARGLHIVHCSTTVFHEETGAVCVTGEAEVILPPVQSANNKIAKEEKA